MSTDYFLAWTAPLFTGCGLWWMVNGAIRSRGDVPASLGTGWLIGIVLAALCARWRGAGDTVHALQLGLPWLLGVGALAWILAALRLRVAAAADPLPQLPPVASIWRVVWWLLLALVVVRLALVGGEAALRPVFPWDAWSAWAVKPKTWMLLGHAEPFVPMVDWLSHPQAATRTMMAWNYPELLAWIEVWFASGAGGWNEPLVNLAWSGALAAFALALYGHARALGLQAGWAMVLVYALVSLPLIDTHVALAGYADLWIAVTLGLAVMAWTRWIRLRQPGQLLLAIALALCLPAIKLEGAVWLMAFLAVVILEWIPRRWRWWVPVGLVGLLLIALAFGGFNLPMPGLGRVRIAWGDITIAGVASYRIGWHEVGGAMLASLFTLPNWHLLWYVLPLLVALRWRVLLRDPAAQLIGFLILLQLLFLFMLFFFTSAAAWAEDFTSANRLILQIVPTLFVFGVALFGAVAAREPTDKAPALPASTAPG